MTTPHLPSPELPPISWLELRSFLGLITAMEPTTQKHLEHMSELEHLDSYDSPHAHAWHVSMHASEFPGDPTTACARYLAYRLANVPADQPMAPWVTGTGQVGKAGELWIANAWYQGRQLLAVPEDKQLDRYKDMAKLLVAGRVDEAIALAKRPIHQLGFQSPEQWLTGSTDLPILPVGWTRPYIVEIKCKDHDVIRQMVSGDVDPSSGQLRMREWYKKHELQLKATIGLAHEYDWGEVTVERESWKIVRSDVHERLGLEDGMIVSKEEYQRISKAGDTVSFKIDQPVNGEIYYWSRSWPRGKGMEPGTKSFGFAYEPSFIAEGRKVLDVVRQSFIDDVLPQRDGTFIYSREPCNYCNFKKICRDDSGLEPKKRKPTLPVTERISESHAVRRALELRGEDNYHYGATRAAVFERWGEADPLAHEFETPHDIVEKHIELPTFPKPEPVKESSGNDLMAALEQSLENVRKRDRDSASPSKPKLAGPLKQ